MSLNSLKDALANTAIYKGKRQTSLLITVALAITPLIIDSMITDDSHLCPKNHPYLISLMFLFGPAFCLSLINLSFAIKYLREHDLHSKTFIYKRLLFRMFSLVIMVCVTVGFSFLLSEHFVCLMSINSVPGSFDKQELVLLSREIGWSIIIGTLLFAFTLALIQLILYRRSYVDRVYEIYLNNLRRQANQMLEESLRKLSKGIMNKKLDYITKGSNEHILKQDVNFVDVITQFKNEQQEILLSRNDFRPQKSSLKDRLHFFSIHLDESFDHKIIQL